VAKLVTEEMLMMRKYSQLQDQARKYAKQKRERVGLE
jgi:hypothetical protein